MGIGYAFAPVDADAQIVVALEELRGAEIHLNVVWIRVAHDEVVACVASIDACFAPVGSQCADRMRPQIPVRCIDDVDVLLDDDISRELFVVRPSYGSPSRSGKPALFCSGTRPA